MTIKTSRATDGVPGRSSLRYGDLPTDPKARLFGLFGTAFIALVIAACSLLSWQVYSALQPQAHLAVFDVAMPAAPPEPANEIPPGPKQVRKETARAHPDRPQIEIAQIRAPDEIPVAQEASDPIIDPGPPIEKTSAPESKPAPPAQKASDARPTWEGQVLAALNKAKRYPREAAFRRQQGVPYIRFVMSREGKVVSVRLERSSGIRSLDDEAVSLPERAAPLPRPPEGVKGDTIELVVPVEFFMQR